MIVHKGLLSKEAAEEIFNIESRDFAFRCEKE